jgi:hypothetical protein
MGSSNSGFAQALEPGDVAREEEGVVDGHHGRGLGVGHQKLVAVVGRFQMRVRGLALEEPRERIRRRRVVELVIRRRQELELGRR